MKNLLIFCMLAFMGFTGALPAVVADKRKTNDFMSDYENLVKTGKIPSKNLTNHYRKIQSHLENKPRVAIARVKNRPQYKSHHKHKSHTGSSKPKTCLTKHLLTCKDFERQGVIITEPGYYCLAQDVEFRARFDNTAAITIQSSDVILDLSTHVLSQSAASFDAFDNVSAIIVASGYNFVTIKNGQIKNFSNHGILAESDNFGSPDDHHGIYVEDMIVLDCGKITTDDSILVTRFGIGVLGTTDCVIQNCDVSGIRSFTDPEAIGIFYSDNILIKNCLTHDNFGDPDEGFGEGIAVNFFNNATIVDSSAINNRNSQPIGIYIYTGTNLVMENCKGNENVADFPEVNRAFCAGIAVYFTDAAILENCEGNFNIAQSELIGSNVRKFCTGIQIALSTAELHNCTASFNSATSDTGLSGGGCVGFDINTVNSCILKGCFAEGNSNYSIDETGGGGGVFGFDCDKSSNIYHEDCVAIANNAEDGGTPQKTGGFYASIFPEGGDFNNIVYKNCKSLNHTCAFEGTTVAGFLIGESPPTTIVVTPSQIILDGCIAEGNVNTTNPGNSAGISLENGTTLSTISNCQLIGNGIGILLRGTDTNSNLIENNQVTGNLVYGIEDGTSNFSSFAKNYAYNVDAFENYRTLPDGTPIRTWQIGFPPAAVDNNGILDPLDNISVTN